MATNPNARDFFSTAAPFRVYHNFGGSIGGPIRKDKTFFFANYEGSREAAKVVITGNTPLSPWRGGDFSSVSTPIVDPMTGTPFPANQIPANRINPVSQKIQDFFFPAPNFGPSGLLSGNWRGQFPGQTGFTHFNDWGVRVDHNFSDNDKVYTRVNYRQLPLTAREATLPPVGQRDQIRGSRSAVISWTHLFSSSVLNEARTGFTRQRNYYFPSLVGSDIIQQVGYSRRRHYGHSQRACDQYQRDYFYGSAELTSPDTRYKFSVDRQSQLDARTSRDEVRIRCNP